MEHVFGRRIVEGVAQCAVHVDALVVGVDRPQAAKLERGRAEARVHVRRHVANVGDGAEVDAHAHCLRVHGADRAHIGEARAVQLVGEVVGIADRSRRQHIVVGALVVGVDRGAVQAQREVDREAAEQDESPGRNELADELQRTVEHGAVRVAPLRKRLCARRAGLPPRGKRRHTV